MRKSSTVVAAALIAATAAPSAVLAQDATAVAVTDLNMRAGPAPYFPVVAVIPANTAVTLHGCLDEEPWCDVTLGTARGWSYAEYLSVQGVAAIQAETLPPPTTFEAEAYFDAYYRDEPFYEERDRWFGAAGGAAGGAVIGALLFGPVGAAVGAAVGGAAGGAFAEAITPPDIVVEFVTDQDPQPVFLDGAVIVGATVPDVVTVSPIPDYDYGYAYVNGQWVLVEPASRQIVYVFR